ncbi:P-loop NTPase fold protein [Streptomyces melanogenes]|uniref:P-loop NTPase fold protein n=1 Tax=Streptomyces melanogenes TaxID=67326 RepID=UPI00167C9361|nr:P-loop NTPase fold protein [Streptomyces melanogenes]
MRFEVERVALVLGKHGDRLIQGTGYLIADDTVLTVAHLFGDGAQGGRVHFMHETAPVSAEVLWSHKELDLALLGLRDEGDPSRRHLAEPVRWGTLAGLLPLEAQVTGFPELARAGDGGLDIHQLISGISPVSGVATARWKLDVSAVPARSDGISPFRGMSGAPVFVGDLLVGVAVDHRSASLNAARIESLADEAEFVELFTQRAGVPWCLEICELADVLRPPLPPRRFSSPESLLAPELAVVPFGDKGLAFQQLTDWCTSRDPVSVCALIAPGGYGKTRLAWELARRMAARHWTTGTLKPDAPESSLAAVSQIRGNLLVIVDEADAGRENQVHQLTQQAAVALPSARIRILVVARSTQWWRALAERGRDETGVLYQSALHVELLPAEDPAERRQVFEAATRAFARVLPRIPGLEDKPWDTIVNGIETPDLAGDEYMAMISVQAQAMFALLAAHPGTASLVEALKPARSGSAAREVSSESSTGRDPSAALPDGEGSVHTHGFGDRPAETDLLNRQPLVAAVTDLLVPSDWRSGSDRPRQSLDSTGPSVVALEGPWGSGKTTMMWLIESEIARRKPAPPAEGTTRRRWRRRGSGRHLSALAAYRLLRPPRSGAPHRTPAPSRRWRGKGAPERPAPSSVVTAHFTPWSHQTRDQIWAGLTRAVVEATEPALGEKKRARERYWLQRNRARLDCRQLRRAMLRRMLSPLLRVAVFALLAPAIAQLVKGGQNYTVAGHDFTAVQLALGLPLVLLALGILHSLGRLLAGRARSFLNGQLLDGPVLSGPLAPGSDASTDGTLHDPYYNARSGYLYLVQHDMRELLAGLQDTGHELVVFIDDLDRCSPSATADVFEAINLFLSGALQVRTSAGYRAASVRCRFVLGLDPVVVAAHLDRAYADLATSKALQTHQDPSWGWTFLRKLVQLPVTLPSVAHTSVATALEGLLGAVTESTAPHTTPTGAAPSGTAAAPPGKATSGATPPPNGLPTAELRLTYQAERDSYARALEAHPAIRERLEQRLCAQNDVSLREAKRVLTIWQFYLRVLAHKGKGVDQLNVAEALHLVVLAEITARWPALQPNLRRSVDGVTGLERLAQNTDDDIAWARARTRIGLDDAKHTQACGSLRKLLTTYDGKAVAGLAHKIS